MIPRLLLLFKSWLLFLLCPWQVRVSGGDADNGYDRDNNKNQNTATPPPPFTIANMTCEFFTQPLNHFDLPRNQSGFYQQRVCFYNGFLRRHHNHHHSSSSSLEDDDENDYPILLYTGNESPLEEYINHTGLIWETAPLLGAQVVFAEHRYEGQSLPRPDVPHCLAYAASYQALADFANLIEHRLFNSSDASRRRRRPVIVLGGSYGGMLAAWMRMVYPHLVAGAIAGSAPIGGFPTNRPKGIDTAYRVIAHGLAQPYPPTKKTTTTTTATTTGSTSSTSTTSVQNHCPHNLLAVWPLIQILSSEDTGRALLQQTFRLCDPPPADDPKGRQLIAWAQSPWFDFAEGSFPYPSAYIPYALTHKPVPLPAWPLQAACWTHSALHADWDITFQGNISNVLYNITYGDSGLSIAVDWDQATPSLPCQDNSDDNDAVRCWQRLHGSDSIRQLLESTRDALSIWFNVTQDVPCYSLAAAPNTTPRRFPRRHSSVTDSRVVSSDKSTTTTAPQQQTWRHLLRQVSETISRSSSSSDTRSLPAAEQCAKRMAQGSWPLLCCNEEMNLIITEAPGLGKDCFWPPHVPRGTQSCQDLIALRNNSQELDEECQDPDGIFGFPQSPPDPWAQWMDIRYGGLHLSGHSNIVFSNGLLDPWSAAGVYGPGVDPDSYYVHAGAKSTATTNTDPNWQPYHGIPGLYVQNVTPYDDRMIALIMDVGGHHTDLMYSNKADPPSIREARKVEQDYMRRWIHEFWTQEEVDTIS